MFKDKLQTQKKEVEQSNGSERTRATRVYNPRVDIVSQGNDIMIWAEMPGVSEQDVDITVENNILTINGFISDSLDVPDGYRLAYQEYGVGDFQRTFTLSDEIDRNKIEATLRDGVLKVTLPKAPEAQARKISVKAG